MQIRILIVVFFISIGGFAQSPLNESLCTASSKTALYLNLFVSADGNNSPSTEKIYSLINKLELKRNAFSSDKNFLKFLFTKTHQKLLKHYAEYCSFNALLNDGTYNCLTGTALYALLLDHFHIDYKVIETNYHIFLLANTNSGQILFESTDPINGFVHAQKEIEKRISKYKQNELIASASEKVYYRYNFDLYNSVDLDQLLGLMYYNLSIESYNKHAFPMSINYLDEAVKLYKTSERMNEFSKIILLTLKEGNVSVSDKETCLKQIQSLRKKMPGLASNNAN